jgi:menaquinone-dependent protoporphyrinogen oxidase
MTIVILYSTDHGSTGEIAGYISSHIAEQLPPTEVHNIQDFDASLLDKYTAIIIGSPVHGAQWLDESIKFCSTHKDALISKPLFTFSVGAPGTLPKVLRNKWAELEERTIHQELQRALDGKVRMHTLFNGKVEKNNEPLFLRLCCGIIGGMTYGDLREWNKVEAWAKEVVTNLKGGQDMAGNGGNNTQEA